MRRIRLPICAFLMLAMVSWYAPAAFGSLAATTVFEVQTAGLDDFNTVSAVVTAGGTGYANNDVLTVSAGTSTTAATFTATVSGGVVTSVTPTNTGHYTVLPTNAVATTVAPAGGTGCTLTITWNTGGNGGAFDPGQVTNTANHAFTDGTTTANTGNTTAPVFKSASYNFVAGDVGAWVYQSSTASGWAAGWYHIDSVASNQATLDARIGHVVLSNYTLNTVAGISTAATPTSGIWAIDYSQSTSPLFSYTDLSSTGNGLTCSSVAHPFGRQMVGNSFTVMTGTNFNAANARYVIASVSGTTATVLGVANIHTTAGTNSDGTGNFGGCLATPGMAGAVMLASNTVFYKTGTYTFANTTANTPAGPFNLPGGTTAANTRLIGYSSLRGDKGTRPTFLAGSAFTSAAFIVSNTGSSWQIDNIIFDGNLNSTVRGVNDTANPSRGLFTRCKFSRLTNASYASGGATSVIAFTTCEFAGCTTTTVLTQQNTMNVFGCTFQNNTVTPVSINTGGGHVEFCIFANNTGSSTDGIIFNDVRNCSAVNCTFYGNGRHGINVSVNATTLHDVIRNCLCVNNGAGGSGGYGINVTAAANGIQILSCAGFNNNSGDINTTNGTLPAENFVTLTASPFVSATNFKLNNTSGGGRSCRHAGIPGSLPGLTGVTGYLDIGAVQHSDLVINGRGR